MSTEAVHQVGGTFQKGTKLRAVARTSDFYTGVGPVHAEATVDKNLEVHFKGLVDNGPYWLVGEVELTGADGKKHSETRAEAFTAHDEEVRSLAPDVATSQAATRLGIEKASAGALAVRAGDKALAVEPASTPDERHNPVAVEPPVVGARSSSKSKPKRSTRRGADNPQAKSRAKKK